jgi:hypothetical protein
MPHVIGESRLNQVELHLVSIAPALSSVNHTTTLRPPS